ncbi:MAG: glycosyltransferase family 4 protein [Candidatus Methanoperedens sp.]
MYKKQGGNRLKVAIGPVFDEFGGVSQHISGIKKFSSHDIAEVPSRFVRKALCKGSRRIWLYKKILNKLGLNGYDVVHSHVDPWFTQLCMDSRTKTCKWVHTYHTLYFEEDYPDGLQKWQKDINRVLIETASKADVRISISKWLHDYLSETYSIQTEIIPNCFDSELCEKANADKFFKKYGLSDFILFVGNIQAIKNPQLFIELAKRIPEAKFVMIGRNIDALHLMNNYKISIPKNLILMAEMPHADTLDAISACRVFVMTSKREGIPTVLLEAMGFGKPVVAPAHSGCREVIQNGEYGFLYKPDSLEDLVDKTNQALLSMHFWEKAKARVLKNYDWKIITQKIDSIYEL